MTQEQLQHASGATSANAARFLPYVIQTCEKYGIDTPIKQLCFLAQVGHESGGLFYTEELASGAAYEGRADLGNTQQGDGVRFKGRGLIQITGRANYTAIGHDLGEDFISQPTLLGGKNAPVCTAEQLQNAAMSAGWFWDRTHLNAIAAQMNINEPIDTGNNLVFFKQITKKINGGYNGLQDRISRCVAGAPYFKTA